MFACQFALGVKTGLKGFMNGLLPTKHCLNSGDYSDILSHLYFLLTCLIRVDFDQDKGVGDGQ